MSDNVINVDFRPAPKPKASTWEEHAFEHVRNFATDILTKHFPERLDRVDVLARHVARLVSGLPTTFSFTVNLEAPDALQRIQEAFGGEFGRLHQESVYRICSAAIIAVSAVAASVSDP